MKAWVSKNQSLLVITGLLGAFHGTISPAFAATDPLSGLPSAICFKAQVDGKLNLPAFKLGSWTPKTGDQGPIIRALHHNRNLTPRGSIIKLHGEEFKVVDWGIREDGEKVVRLSKPDGTDVKDHSFKEFPKEAFQIHETRLDELMKFHSDDVINRTMRDHPGMSRELATKAFEDMKKWFFVKFRAQVENPDHMSPYMYNELDSIDYDWHAFLLFTKAYTEFGKKYFHTYLHHTPSLVKDPEAQRVAFYNYVKDTLGDDTYKSWFISGEFNPHEHSLKDHLALIKPFANKKATQPGVYEVLDQPQIMNSMFEVYAVSYPRGKERGALYHLRPRPNAQKIAEADPNYVPLKTEMNPTSRGLFEFLHGSVGRDPKIGEYWKTIASPELYNSLALEWNVLVGNDPARAIHVYQQRAGGINQIPMAKFRVRSDSTIAVAGPRDPNTVPDGLKDSAPIEVDPATGRAKQSEALFSHDEREADSVITLSRSILDSQQRGSAIWLKVHDILKNNTSLPMSTDAEAKRLSKLFLDYAKDHPSDSATRSSNGFTPDGAQWWRLAEIAMYHNQRRYHSMNHLLTQLIRAPRGLASDGVFATQGPINQSEMNIHRWGLGAKAGKLKDDANQFSRLSFEEGTDPAPLTLEKAIEAVTNGELDRIKRFADQVPDPQVKQVVAEYLASQKRLTPAEIKKMADEQRERYRVMGQGLVSGG